MSRTDRDGLPCIFHFVYGLRCELEKAEKILKPVFELTEEKLFGSDIENSVM